MHFRWTKSWTAGLSLAVGAVLVVPLGVAEGAGAFHASDASSITQLDGTLPDGTVWRIRKPDHWNGILINDLDYQSSSDGPAYALLNQEGYATSGTARPAWRNEHYDNLGELHNQVSVIKKFEARFGNAKMVIQYGHSGGGLISEAMAELYPHVIDGAVVGCAHDNVGLTSQYLDLVFALKALLAPKMHLPLVHIPLDASKITARWRRILTRAQATPEGRAKIALAVTIAQFPSWSQANTPEPDPADAEAVQRAMFDTVMDASGFNVQVRYLFEHYAGGNPDSNVDVDYNSFYRNADQSQRWVVQSLYDQAGRSLGHDIAAINRSPRVKADKKAVRFYDVQGRTPSGDIRVPVLRTHTTGDVYVPPSVLEGYENQIRKQGRDELYREAIVDRYGHCTFTPAEVSVAVATVVHKVKTGAWGDTSPATLNSAADALKAGGGNFVAYQSPRTNRAVYLDLDRRHQHHHRGHAYTTRTND